MDERGKHRSEQYRRSSILAVFDSLRTPIRPVTGTVGATVAMVLPRARGVPLAVVFTVVGIWVSRTA